jgi:uncharacterized membrane protein HdeD (DUF308 family)
MLADVLSRFWWGMLFRGALWIFFGIVVLTQPSTSLLALTFLFGGLALVDGITRIVAAFGGYKSAESSSWILVLSGIAGIIVGLMALMTPQITAMVLLMYIAAWAIVTGLFEIFTAVVLRKEIEGEFWLGLAGLLSVAFGVFVIARPAVGALSLLWLIGAYAVVYGLILVVRALETRWMVRTVAGKLRS